MKNRGMVVSGLMALLAMVAGSIAAADAGFASRSGLQSSAPSVVSYSGHVAIDGVPFDGTGYFKFAIVDMAGTTSYWSNDGSSSGGSEPTTAVELAVDGGDFDVLLGDTSLPHMTQPLVPSIFEGVERYLRLWFSAGAASYEQLSPDRRVASVPYALQTANADTLDGQHADDLGLPSGAMVLSTRADDPGLIAAGFTATGIKVQSVAWSYRERMPTDRVLLAATEVNGITYAMGGHVDGGVLAAMEAYDPISDAWAVKAPMPTARQSLAAAAVNGAIYAMGGMGSDYSALDVVERYSPATNSWTPRAPLPTARSGLAAAAVGGVIYALGGRAPDGSVLATVEAYNPVANSWAAKASMPTAREWPAAVAVAGIIYVIGGAQADGSALATVEAYDPASNSWSQRTSMHSPRWSLAAAALGSSVYALGGYGGSGMEDILEVYDSESDSWAFGPDMLTGRYGLGAVTVGSSIYALGGSFIGANEVYTPQPTFYVFRKD